MLLREYKRVLQFYKAVKDRKIACLVCGGAVLLIAFLCGVSAHNRLCLLKKENILQADSLERFKKNLAQLQSEIREKDAFIKKLDQERAELKLKNEQLFVLNAVGTTNPGGAGDNDPVALESTPLAAENTALKANAARLQSRIQQLEAETATLIKEKNHMEETFAEQVKVVADVSYLKTTNASLVGENAALKKQVHDLQVVLVRIFEQSSSSQ